MSPETGFNLIIYSPTNMVCLFLPTCTSSCGSGSSDASISTIAKTNKDAVELEASIGSQLESAGWKRVTGHAEKPLAWSIGQIPASSKWQGVLLAIQSPQENQYLISVQVTSQEKLSSP